MPDRALGRLAIRQVVSAQLQPEALALDATPGAAQPFARSGAKRLHAVDAGIVQALLHGMADAAQVAQGQSMQRMGKVRLFEHGQAIGFLHV